MQRGFGSGLVAAAGCLVLLALGLQQPEPARGETWICPGPDKTDLYTDHGGPGCRKLGNDNSFQTYKGPSSPTVNPSPPRSTVPVPSPQAAPLPRVTEPVVPKLSHPFLTVTRQVPVLLIAQSMKGQAGYIPNPFDYVIISLRVGHDATGSGPRITSDYHFRGSSLAALDTAVGAAAKAVGYDLRFLTAHLFVETNPFFEQILRFSIDGPSAGLAWAVAVASAILGDPLRPDVCLSGTINAQMEVGPVGGLEDKITACRQIKYRQLIFPAGQGSMDMSLKAMSYEIALTEVKTLAEAYQAATGRSLRKASQAP